MSINQQGWTDDPEVLLLYQALSAMSAGETEAVAIAHALNSGPDEVGQAFATLISQGLAKGLQSRLSETYPEDAVLTAEGRHAVSTMRSARTPSAIKRACPSAILAWLYANDGVRLVSVAQFREDVRAHYFGEPFSAEDIRTAARALDSHGLLVGGPARSGAISRPEITPAGRIVHGRHGGELVDWDAARAARGTTINVTGSTGVVVANNSPGAQQTAHVTTDPREQVLNLAAALEGMSASSLGLEPVDLARAAGLVVELRQAAEVVGSDPGRARRLIGAVKAIAIQGSGSAAGTALVALADAVTQNL